STYIKEVMRGSFQENRSEGLDPRWVTGAREQITLTSSGSSLNFKQLVETSVRDGHISGGVERIMPYLNDPAKPLSADLKSYESELILLAREGMEHLQPLQNALGEYTGSQKQIVDDVKGWVKALSVSSGSTRKYTLLDGDDPCDFLLMGTEVAGSCQRVDGDPNLNKGLVGTMLDGHNHLLLLKDVSGKIVGRALLRLVKEGEKPALLLERIYPQTLGSAEKEQLMNFAKKRSEAFGWPLYGVEFEGTETNVTLTSEGGRGTYQYVDSASRGNQPNGKFTIPKPKLIS
ncbi:MAG: hypothetical protein KDK48_04920, partial [Chlamydiia bacterium]|nr:hypothetical protein [Chlamydiia bacterium]